MQNFIKYLGKTKRAKLAQLENELQIELEKKLNNLKSEYKNHKTTDFNKRKVLLDQMMSKQISNARKKNLFSLLDEKNKLLERIWSSACRKYYGSSANLQEWLSWIVNELPEGGGVIYCGKSYSYLKNKLSGKKQYEVRKAKDLNSSEGYVFESDKYYINLTLENFLEDVYQSNKSAISKILFNDV